MSEGSCPAPMPAPEAARRSAVDPKGGYDRNSGLGNAIARGGDGALQPVSAAARRAIERDLPEAVATAVVHFLFGPLAADPHRSAYPSTWTSRACGLPGAASTGSSTPSTTTRCSSVSSASPTAPTPTGHDANDLHPPAAPEPAAPVKQHRSNGRQGAPGSDPRSAPPTRDGDVPKSPARRGALRQSEVRPARTVSDSTADEVADAIGGFASDRGTPSGGLCNRGWRPALLRRHDPPGVTKAARGAGAPSRHRRSRWMVFGRILRPSGRRYAGSTAWSRASRAARAKGCSSIRSTSVRSRTSRSNRSRSSSPSPSSPPRTTGTCGGSSAS